MTTSIWDEMIAKWTPAKEEDEERPPDRDYDSPTFDEWLRDETERREHDETRHATTRSYASYGS